MWWDSKTAAWAELIIGLGGGGLLAYAIPEVGVPICIVLLLLGLFLLRRAYGHKDTIQSNSRENIEKLSVITFSILYELKSKAESIEKGVTIRKLDSPELNKINLLYITYSEDLQRHYKFCASLISTMDELKLGISDLFDNDNWKASIKKLESIKGHLGNNTINELIDEYVLMVKSIVYDNSFQHYQGWSTHLCDEARNKFLNQIQAKLSKKLNKYGYLQINGVTESNAATHPIVSVEAKVYYDCAKLEITNSGSEADFTATARVVEGVPEPEIYHMCWEPIPAAQHHINKGDTATISVAEISTGTVKHDSVVLTVFRGGIALFRFGEKGRDRIGTATIEMVEQRGLSERYPSMVTSTWEDKCIIEITLTASPALLEPFEKRRYCLKIDHENGHKLLFDPC